METGTSPARGMHCRASPEQNRTTVGAQMNEKGTCPPGRQAGIPPRPSTVWTAAKEGAVEVQEQEQGTGEGKSSPRR